MVRERSSCLGQMIMLFVASAAFLYSCPGQCAETTEEVSAQMARDFAPVAASIKVVEEGVVVLNRGGIHGIRRGDLFQVYSRGKPVIDRKSHETIGYVKQPVGILKVMSLSGNNATCATLLNRGHAFSAGQSVMRYSDMKAAFLSRREAGGEVAARRRLEILLPHLAWTDIRASGGVMPDSGYLRERGIMLLFDAGEDALSVYGQDLALLSSYPLEKGRPPMGESRGPRQTTGHPRHSDAFRSSLVNPESKGSADIEFRLSGRLRAGSLQVDVTDIDGDGLLEIVYLVSSGLYISPYRNSGPVVSYRIRLSSDPVSFSALRGEGWLSLNSMIEDVGMRSVLLKYGNGKIRVVENDINLWLNASEISADGIGSYLWGQSFDADNFFGRTVYRLEPDSQGLVYLESIEPPMAYSILRSYWADLNGNGVVELCILDSRGMALVYEAGRQLWASSQKLAKASPDRVEQVYFEKTDLNHDGRVDVVFSGIDVDSSANEKERLYSLSWQDGSYRINPLGLPLEGNIRGLSMAEGSLIVALDHPFPQDQQERETILLTAAVP